MQSSVQQPLHFWVFSELLHDFVVFHVKLAVPDQEFKKMSRTQNKNNNKNNLLNSQTKMCRQ